MNEKRINGRYEEPGKAGLLMTEGIVEKVLKAGAQVTQLGHQAARIRTAASDAIEDAKMDARRAAKRGYNLAEDLVEDTAHRIKRAPLQSVAVGFGAGLLAGAIFARLLRR